MVLLSAYLNLPLREEAKGVSYGIVSVISERYSHATTTPRKVAQSMHDCTYCSIELRFKSRQRYRGRRHVCLHARSERRAVERRAVERRAVEQKRPSYLARNKTQQSEMSELLTRGERTVIHPAVRKDRVLPRSSFNHEHRDGNVAALLESHEHRDGAGERAKCDGHT
jgi:hypothetical protein